jgi:1-pyrroline-5-carboxylate dehydrogenase
VGSIHPKLVVSAGFSLRKLKLAATRLKCNLFNSLISKFNLGIFFREKAAMLAPFQNEPLPGFSGPDEKDEKDQKNQTKRAEAYRLALAEVRRRLGSHKPLIIGGEKVDTGERIVSLNPAKPAELIGTVAVAGPAQIDAAFEAAWGAFPEWAACPVAERAAATVRLASELRRRKLELAAWETLEASKNWGEAEADVAEAIDFCEYYARQVLEWTRPVPITPYRGEINESWLQPLGAGAVISPWNFPLAILVGMTMGPVAAGNTVVLKPSSNTPIIAAAFLEAAAAAGIPDGVINFLPGTGSEMGDYLVDHIRCRFINFTGSKEVGIGIGRRAAQVHPGQLWLKRAFLEMGGKDAMVVDETADLEAATAAVVKSAFGFQGQKCSAASRVIVVEEVYPTLLEMLKVATKNLQVGPAEENCAVGAVISQGQYQMILAEIDQGKAQAKLLVGGSPVDLDGGYYIEPTIFAEVPADSRLGQHEIFGPVLSVIRARNFDEAVALFNQTEYGLTGGLFSRSRKRIERAKRQFYVGNLYINREITGARVGVQPFGGFKMSGSNAKAGGPDYVRLFMEMKTVAERI